MKASDLDIRVLALLGLFILVFAVVFIGLPPIPQDLKYSDFADQVTHLQIPNAINVLTNIPFLLVGILGLTFAYKHKGDRTKFIDAKEVMAFYWAFGGLILMGLGSAWFHWNPSFITLVPDRLPITIGYMAILAIFISERVNVRAGFHLLPVLIFIGLFSVLFWIGTELPEAYTGDLRLFVLVQFFPIVAILLLVLWYPARYSGTSNLFWILIFYVLSKLAESRDNEIYDLTADTFSGHSLKHLLVAVVGYFLYLYLKNRKPVKS